MLFSTQIVRFSR